MNILAVDPGPTPGLAVYDVDRKWFHAWVAPSWENGCLDVCATLDGRAFFDVIVCESFSIGGQRAKASNETIEMIGVARWFALQQNVPFVLQTPADAAGFGTPAKLKALGWWTPGKADHARSATQHLLLYLSRNQLIDVARLLS